ncbi:MAG: LacI family DNA-binding transcriptional regulator [Gulosibacter sp.]|uniref:LacI family DNA-binding transcriptional regulator n=1 Tax=Gulosibacter sp. TaxID=2817531 RepID=UPI003F8DEA95
MAELAGVHVATASRALSANQFGLVNSSTRKRVLESAAQLGYRPNAVAQSLRKGTTDTLGVVVADLSNPYFVELLRGVDDEAKPLGVMPLVAETHDDPGTLRRVVSRLIANRVDAVIVSAVHITDQEFIKSVEAQIPVILAVRTLPDPEDSHGHIDGRREALQDDLMGARTAVSHLINIGHRRIAQLQGTPAISSFIGRSQGYHEAITQNPNVRDLSHQEVAQSSTIAEGYRLTKTLLEHRLLMDRPTAIFAHNDLLAVGAIDAIRELGLRCPEDISVVGYNDAPLIDHIDPPLSTVRLPARELGRHSARLAFSAISGDASSPVRIMLVPEFVERSSTAPPSI